MPEQAKATIKLDAIELNKSIAYKGEIGRKREIFCKNFINQKKEILREIQADQQQTVIKNGEAITCHQGCTYCCLLYAQANIPECEAIVYYLYHHPAVLTAFLSNYRPWRRKLKLNGDIFKKCAELWQDQINEGPEGKAHQALVVEAGRYQQQGLLCPFILGGACSIYEVRPYTCAGMIATSQSRSCLPGGSDKAKVYQTRTSAVMDNSFYYQSINGDILAFMPLVVYGLLKDGYKLLANIPGLAGLDKAALNDPEVRDIIRANRSG
jgi:hypothetical protein